MADVEHYEMLVLGSGGAGQFLAWTMAKADRRTAMVERRWLAGRVPTSPACRAKT